MSNEKTVTYYFPNFETPSAMKVFQDRSSQIRAFRFEKEYLNEMLNEEYIKNYSVYFLFDENKNTVYVGQSKNGAKKILEDKKRKGFWDYCIMFVSDNNVFDSNTLDYMEAYFAELLIESNNYNLHSSTTKGKVPKLNSFDKITYNMYVNQIEFLLKAEGLDFRNSKVSLKSKPQVKESHKSLETQIQESIEEYGFKEEQKLEESSSLEIPNIEEQEVDNYEDSSIETPLDRIFSQLENSEKAGKVKLGNVPLYNVNSKSANSNSSLNSEVEKQDSSNIQDLLVDFNEVYEIERGGRIAKIKLNSDLTFSILPGTIMLKPSDKMLEWNDKGKAYRNLVSKNDKLLKEGKIKDNGDNSFTVTSEIVMKSVSGAACLIQGSRENGWAYFKKVVGLKEIYDKLKNSKQ